MNTRAVLTTFGMVVSGTITYYVVLVYMPTFARTQLNMPLGDAFIAQVVGLLCLTAVIPIFGTLSDRIGRKPILITALILYLVGLYPLFSWLHASPSLAHLAIVQAVLCSFVGMFFGPISTALAEQFPVGVRSTGLAIAYNFAVMMFGGFAQFIVTWLIRETGSPIAPAFYVMAGAVVGLVAALFLVERHRDEHLPLMRLTACALVMSGVRLYSKLKGVPCTLQEEEPAAIRNTDSGGNAGKNRDAI